jgi:hypothetical protein
MYTFVHEATNAPRKRKPFQICALSNWIQKWHGSSKLIIMARRYICPLHNHANCQCQLPRASKLKLYSASSALRKDLTFKTTNKLFFYENLDCPDYY